MIFVIATFIANKFNLDFAKARRIAWIALAVAVLFLILASVFVFRSCGDSAPSIDEEKIQDNQERIEKREGEKLSNNLQKSNEVLANTINAARQAEANTRQATNKDYSNTTADELNRKGKEVYR